MSVSDRWHTRKPRIENGQPVERCREHKLYPSKEHGNGDRWQVRWYDEDGKQCSANRPKKTGKDPEIHADAYDTQVQAGLTRGDYIDPAAGKITLEEYAMQWRADYIADPSTLEILDLQLAHIYDVEPGPNSRRAPGKSPIGPRPMRWLSKRPSAIRQWIKALEAKGLSAGYIGNIINTLSSIFNAAIDDGIVGDNPVRAKSVKRPPVNKTKAVPWTREMVLAAAAEMEARCGAGAMVYCGAGAGMRESEVFGLAVDDVAFLGADREIRVRRQVKRIRDGRGGYVLVFAPPKRGKEREVPLSDELSRRLARHIAEHPPVEVTLPWARPDGRPTTARLLFTRRGGAPWHRNRFLYFWGFARAAAGAPPPPDKNGRFHGLRHTFASACLAGGDDIRKLAAWLGHDDPGFTLRTYTHLMPRAGDRSRRAVDSFLAEPVPAGPASAHNVPEGGK